MEADFLFPRTLVVVRNERTVKKTGQTTPESHYDLSSSLPDHYCPSQWLHLVRGHWGGVEIRNHWRRGGLTGEDGSRSRNPNLLAHLALLRSALFALLPDCLPDLSLPQIQERLHSHPAQCFNVVAS